MSSVIKTCTKALENTSTSSYTDRTDYQSIELKTSSFLNEITLLHSRKAESGTYRRKDPG